MRKPSYLCTTLVFMFGSLVGILAGHTDTHALFTFRHAIVVCVASVMFHFTVSTQSLFSKKINNGY